MALELLCSLAATTEPACSRAGLVVLRHMGSEFPDRDWTYVPCIACQILKHWTTREVPMSASPFSSWFLHQLWLLLGQGLQLAIGRASWTNLFTLFCIQTRSKACQLHLSYTDCIFPATLSTLPWPGLCRSLLTWVLLSLRTVPSDCLWHWGQLPGRCDQSLAWLSSKVWCSNDILLIKGEIKLFKPTQGLHFQHYP